MRAEIDFRRLQTKGLPHRLPRCEQCARPGRAQRVAAPKMLLLTLVIFAEVLPHGLRTSAAVEALGIRVTMLDRLVSAARDRLDQEHDTEFRENDTKIAQINAEHPPWISAGRFRRRGHRVRVLSRP